ncbi:hypothetical protein [Prosthecobacter sp.]|uniref:hypothetical protein n=1 Tax=Prosthecobacter sp. TaxID=1965333 RepID=UPI002488762D|nr:hypothetical protein [Prosthecobacter sp.]MDI1315348.1 hypothetical protein [Prosthecobacter sp.]
MENKASFNMPVESKYRLPISPFWLDLLLVSVASRLLLEMNVGAGGLSVRMLREEPMIWLTSQLVLYTSHLFAAYILMPTFVRHNYPKATLLWGSLIAWLLLPPMMPTSVN